MSPKKKEENSFLSIYLIKSPRSWILRKIRKFKYFPIFVYTCLEKIYLFLVRI